jgi:sterol 3beta-glucosyltransferase
MNFGAMIEGLGLGFEPLPWDTREALGDAALRGRLLAGDVVGFFRQAGKQAWERRGPLGRAMREAAQSADLLVGASTTEDTVSLLARALHKPLVHTELAPLTPSSHFASLGLGGRNLGPLNALSHRLGRWVWWRLHRDINLDLARELGMAAPKRAPALEDLDRGVPVLHGFSAALFPPPPDWDPSRHFTGGAWQLGADAQRLPGEHRDAGFAAWLEDGPAPVFLSFGSMPAMQGRDLLELAGDLAEALEIRVVLGNGWVDVDGPDCDLPEGVAIAGDCDHAWLFSRCSAVIHHGGAGSTHSAALAGLPQVVCPFFADQPFWAERVRRSGAGTVLPFKRLNPVSLADALFRALSEPCQDAAARLAESMQAEGGATAAAARIDAWHSEGRLSPIMGG